MSVLNCQNSELQSLSPHMFWLLCNRTYKIEYHFADYIFTKLAPRPLGQFSLWGSMSIYLCVCLSSSPPPPPPPPPPNELDYKKNIDSTILQRWKIMWSHVYGIFLFYCMFFSPYSYVTPNPNNYKMKWKSNNRLSKPLNISKLSG